MGFNSSSRYRRLLISVASGLFFVDGCNRAEDAGNLYNTSFDINADERYFERQCGL